MAKIYAVKSGIKPGIYNNWPECEAQVKGYSGAQFKSFNESETEAAKEYVYGVTLDSVLDESKDCYYEKSDNYFILPDMIFYVDGSYNTNYKQASYGIVAVKNNMVLYKDFGLISSDDSETRNVIGELTAAKRCIELALVNDYKAIEICYDYAGIEKWATDEWKANTPVTKAYQNFMWYWKKHINIKFTKIKAHTGNKFNEMADETANKAFEKLLIK